KGEESSSYSEAIPADFDVCKSRASVDGLPFASYGFLYVSVLVLLFLSCQRLFYEESMVGILFRIRRCKMERFCFSSNLDVGRSLFGCSSWCGSKSASFSCFFDFLASNMCPVIRIFMFPSSIGVF
ncbi:hypothetical protein NC651_040191, partial [Populus alba x Populus x berolinensis]